MVITVQIQTAVCFHGDGRPYTQKEMESYIVRRLEDESYIMTAEII